MDLNQMSIREVNSRLQGYGEAVRDPVHISNPMGKHALAVGLTTPVDVTISGHVGYYCAGMNTAANITIQGNAGTGVAENMMSGVVRVDGDASQSAGATGHGGLLFIQGDASARCAVGLKGLDVVVGGNVGHMSAFMAQAGRLVVCGNAGAYLGDSIYEAELFVRGSVESLGADCEEKPMDNATTDALAALLERAGLNADAQAFRRYGSARRLYNFHVDNAGSY